MFFSMKHKVEKYSPFSYSDFLTPKQEHRNRTWKEGSKWLYFYFSGSGIPWVKQTFNRTLFNLAVIP